MTKRGKRERLVESAREVLHQQGVQTTTIADVAQAADVPVGNVYYYFKTKDELVAAAIDARADQIRATLESFERRRSPSARLKALAGAWVDARELVARYGCPLGSLGSELDKREDGLQREAAKLMSLVIDWAEDQFREMGRRDARELAITLFAGVQGAALLANTFRDPDIMRRQARRLEHWIDSLA
jgi:TetR/AcrR family transcriptional regulator, transcriptional repressor for nem operon